MAGATGGAAADDADPLLQRLASNALTSQSVAALRLWVAAQRGASPELLTPLMTTEFTDPVSYGVRYQLLPFDLLERSGEPDIRRQAIERRRTLAATLLLEVARGTTRRGDHDRVRYWAAYALSRVGESAFRAGPRTIDQHMAAFGAMQNAAELSSDTGRPKRLTWYEEREAMNGPVEFISPSADYFERIGKPELALRLRVQAAIADIGALERLRLLFDRMNPNAAFDEFWDGARLAGRPSLPAVLVPAVAGESLDLGSLRGGWHLLALMNTDCASCLAQFRELETLSRRFPGTVVTLVVGDPRDTVAAFVADVA
jgi:hypothetical protein